MRQAGRNREKCYWSKYIVCVDYKSCGEPFLNLREVPIYKAVRQKLVTLEAIEGDMTGC